MDQPPIETQPARYGASRRDRSVAVVLSLVTSLLLFATLVAMGEIDAPGGGSGARLIAMSISGDRPKSAERSRAPAKARQTQQAQAVAATKTSIIPPAIVPTRNTLALPEGFIQLSRADMTASDIGRMAPVTRAGDGGEGGGQGGGKGEGEGPGGAHLYAAQWYREPRDAELAGYMPANREPGQWAVIACRTIEQYHVEDCRELDEFPRGSGAARAMRQAAWQFLVRPPRVDGKPIIGAWVRIRFDFTRKRNPAPDEG